MLKRAFTIVITGLFLGAAIFWTFSCAVNPVTGKSELMLLSEADEMQLGKQTDGEVVAQYGIYQDKKLAAYVDALCQQLARVSHRPNLNYSSQILDASVVNAFAVPGGYVYFTRGILSYLNSEAELAGVMGHEIGHITARHSAQQYSRAQLAQMGLGVGMLFSETLGHYGELAQFGMQMMFLKFSRDNERQADDLGVEYSTKAGYDATQMANFFETLERMHSSSDNTGLPSWFSTHPNPTDRVGAVRRKTKEWQSKLNLKDPEIGRSAYLRQIDGLVIGEDPSQGYVANRVFYHPALRFQFPVPANWNLQNTPTVVKMTSPQNDAAFVFTISSARTPSEAAQAFVRQTQAAVVESDRIAVNGLSSYRLVSKLRSQEGVLGAMSYFIEKDNQVYEFHGLSPVSVFPGYRSTFVGTMQGFKRLTDPNKLKVKPARLRIRAVPSAGSLRQALRSLDVPADKLDELALLNGKNLDDRVSKNYLVKTVE
jgi:predicted Zn-dependent protease